MLTDGAAEKRYKSVIVGLFYWACYVVSYSEWKRNSGRNELSVKSGHPLPQSQGEEFRVRSATPRKEPAEVENGTMCHAFCFSDVNSSYFNKT